jgi:hypothetical protein
VNVQLGAIKRRGDEDDEDDDEEVQRGLRDMENGDLHGKKHF